MSLRPNQFALGIAFGIFLVVSFLPIWNEYRPIDDAWDVGSESFWVALLHNESRGRGENLAWAGALLVTGFFGSRLLHWVIRRSTSGKERRVVTTTVGIVLWSIGAGSGVLLLLALIGAAVGFTTDLPFASPDGGGTIPAGWGGAAYGAMMLVLFTWPLVIAGALAGAAIPAIRCLARRRREHGTSQSQG